MPHFKFNAVGSVELYDDPLGHPVLTLTPDDAETVGAIFAHLERNREKWQATANQRKQEKTKKIEAPPEEANQAVLPGPAVSGQGKVKQFALSAG
ncbi:MAG TPA: hypothetical protein VKW06_08820 [Candidatus Angelobacter sp.]|nr:hypothetical protein [Candidatus Angelobacter sp.]